MKIFIGFSYIVLVGLFFSCKSTQNLDVNKVDKTVSSVSLTDDQQRKFDVFYYESIREKMLGNYEKSASYLSECLRIDPNSSASMYELANLYILSKQFAKAQILLEKAIEVNPNNIWYNLFLADLYQNNGFGPKAIKIYEQLVFKYPTNEEYLFMLAQLYAQNDRSDEAIKTFNKLESLVGINEVISLEKERLYVKLGNAKLAFSEVDHLINKYPFDAKFLGFKGDLYLNYKSYDEAERMYLSTFQIDSTYDIINFSLSYLHSLNNNKDLSKTYFLRGIYSPNVDLDIKIQKLLPFIVDEKADSFLVAIELDSIFNYLVATYSFDSRVYILAGDFYKKQSRNSEGLKALKQAVDIDKSNERVWEQLLFLEIEMQLINELVNDGQVALEYFPQNTIIYMLLSSGYMQLKAPEKAVSILIKGLSFVDPNNKLLQSQFHSSLGDAYYELDSIKSSFSEYEIALSLNDRNIGALNNYSYYLSLLKIDLDKAERMSSRCIELEPGNATYLDTYAWVLFQKERYLEAKFIIERAIDNDKEENSTIIEHYGDILFFNGDIEGAVKQWEVALNKGVNSKNIVNKIKYKKYIE